MFISLRRRGGILPGLPRSAGVPQPSKKTSSERLASSAGDETVRALRVEEMLLGLLLAAFAAMVLLAFARYAPSGLSACCTFAIACLKGLLVSRSGPAVVACKARASAGVAGRGSVAAVVEAT